MAGHTRLSFRYKLTGSNRLRVQIFSLSNEYHRCADLTEMRQGEWASATVDMTRLRRPDGTGGPLAADERIDDIQFYVAADADLLIDDVVLYEPGPKEESEPFPKRVLFTGWFDTGTRADVGKGKSGSGNEWPGTFEIVAHEQLRTWKCARAAPPAEGGPTMLRIGLRGRRPIPQGVRLRFDYRIDGADALRVRLIDRSTGDVREAELNRLKRGEWSRASVDLSRAKGADGAAAAHADELELTAAAGATISVDDVLLYEPGE
jgi:hypothetical protein